MKNNFITGTVRHSADETSLSGFTVCGLKDRDAATGGRSRPKILEYNDAVLEWLGKDEGNLQKFYENPKDAFREATGVEDVVLRRSPSYGNECQCGEYFWDVFKIFSYSHVQAHH